MHIICEHLHDFYTFNSRSGWKGLKKFIPRDCLISPLIYIIFSMDRDSHGIIAHQRDRDSQ